MKDGEIQRNKKKVNYFRKSFKYGVPFSSSFLPFVTTSNIISALKRRPLCFYQSSFSVNYLLTSISLSYQSISVMYTFSFLQLSRRQKRLCVIFSPQTNGSFQQIISSNFTFSIPPVLFWCKKIIVNDFEIIVDTHILLLLRFLG